MASKLMTKSEAMEYCSENGYKLFIDKCIRENVIIRSDPVPIKVSFLTNDYPDGLIIEIDGKRIWEVYSK